MKLHVNFVVSILIFILVLSAGAFAYHKVEGWNGLDSIYFVVVTVTTIGYGDFVPQTDIGKIFTIFFSLFGVAFALYYLSLISSFVFKKHFNKKVSQIKKVVEEKQKLKYLKKK